jgi:hypothetical protein
MSPAHTKAGGAHSGTESVQQATEPDWLTRARDFKCAEPFKTRRRHPWRSLASAGDAQRGRLRVQQATD